MKSLKEINENKKNIFLYSKDLKEHVKRNIGADACMFRVGSRKFVEFCAEVKTLAKLGLYKLNSEEKFMLENTNLGEWAIYKNKIVALDLPMIEEKFEKLNEAEYQGKKVELNKPKKGGPKKYYVYVNAGKNKDGSMKVKKVTWGYPGMRVRISDPERRKSFKARHKCEQQNDKTTAAYWACRTGRYPHLTGSSKSYQWW
jgi:hypothetical protein